MNDTILLESENFRLSLDFQVFESDISYPSNTIREDFRDDETYILYFLTSIFSFAVLIEAINILRIVPH